MYIEQMQNKLTVLKTEEKQLNDDLAVFEINYIQSVEIGKLQEVINIIFKIKYINIFNWSLIDLDSLILLAYDVSFLY